MMGSATKWLQQLIFSHTVKIRALVVAAAKAMSLNTSTANQIFNGQSEVLLAKSPAWLHPLSKKTWQALGKVLADAIMPTYLGFLS